MRPFTPLLLRLLPLRRRFRLLLPLLPLRPSCRRLPVGRCFRIWMHPLLHLLLLLVLLLVLLLL
jgi:hypothetical protein